MGLTPEMLQAVPSLTSQCPSPISTGNTSSSHTSLTKRLVRTEKSLPLFPVKYYAPVPSSLT